MTQSTLPSVKITDVKVILTAPKPRMRLVVVKVLTDQPGLYGLGCATFDRRPYAVASAVENLKPLVIGRDVDRIEDTWQATFVSAYWRSGPVLNNAVSGIDQALWDIKGKRANMPVYQLIGGKVREAVPIYVHASGNAFSEVEERARSFMEQGFRYVRCQVGISG